MSIKHRGRGIHRTDRTLQAVFSHNWQIRKQLTQILAAMRRVPARRAFPCRKGRFRRNQAAGQVLMTLVLVCWPGPSSGR
jgi:aminoglycoside phosphotransferase (APT) family kinase protein